MSIQKYQINDRVKRFNKNFNLTNPKKRKDLLKNNGISDCRYGVITEAVLKTDRKNRASYNYYVKWEDVETILLHSQNTLKPNE